jgi:hypothetical protein
MATTTHERADLRARRRNLEDLRGGADVTGDVYAKAVEKFLTAAEYRDDALMRSAIEEAKAALADSLPEVVDTQLRYSAKARAEVEDFKRSVEGVPIEPGEAFDELGRSLSLLVGQLLRVLNALRDGTIPLARRHGYDVSNAAHLDDHITYWEAVKRDLVDLWPWSTIPLPLPPVDREMVARSRAAFQAGEPFEDIDTLIARLRSERPHEATP